MSYKQFNEDTRVKIPATFQLLRLGYDYQSLSDSDIDFNTKVFVNRFKPALEKINSTSYTDNDILLLPDRKAAQIAVKTVREWMKRHPDSMDRVIFNVFKDEDRRYYEQELY